MVTTDTMITNFGSFSTADFIAAAITFVANIDFDSFGVMNSALYRALFMKLVSDHNLTPEAISFVILLATIVKSKSRIISAYNNVAASAKNAHTQSAIQFITNHTSQYVNVTGRNATQNMPLVKIPESFSSVSTFYFAAMHPNITVSKLINNVFFGNQYLSEFLQDLHEAYERYYWTQVVRSTNNKTSARPRDRPVGTFFTDIYENRKTDSNPFKIANGNTIVFGNIPTGQTASATAAMAVTLNDIASYIGSAKSSIQANVPTAKDLTFRWFHSEFRAFHPAYRVDPTVVSGPGVAVSYLKTTCYDPTTGARVPNDANCLLTAIENNPSDKTGPLAPVSILSGPVISNAIP